MTGAKNKKISSAWRVCKTCANGCCTLLTWVVCAFLALLLFFQIRLATLDEIELSGEALRRLESRFTAHGLSAVFDSARIDLRGNILVRGVRVRANAFEDPLLAIDALQCRVDPVAFLLHRVAPETVRVSGASLRLPAMLSPSGAGEPVVHDIDLALSFHDRILSVEHLTARVENLTLSARGSLMLPQSAGGISWEKIRDAIAGYRARNRRRDEPPGSEEVRAALTGYLAALRNIAGVAGRLAVLDSPHLQLSLAPSRREIATVDAVFSFDGLSVAADKLPPQFQAILARAQSLAGSEPEPAGPLPVLALGPASARLQFPLNPAAPRQPALRARLETLDLPGGIHARNIHLDIPLNLGPAASSVGPDLASGREAQSTPQTTGQFRQHTSRSRPDTRSGPTSAAAAPAAAKKNPPPFTLDSSLIGETSVTIGVLHSPRLTLRDIVFCASPPSRPRINATLAARLYDEPFDLALDTGADGAGATIRVNALVASPHVEFVEKNLLSPAFEDIVRPESPIAVSATVALDGGEFSSVRGFIVSGPVASRNVFVDSAHGEFEYAGGVLRFFRSFATMPDGSHAHGSVDINPVSGDLRFLLDGALRPLRISGWLGPWWPEFWDDFAFPGPPPDAGVDVQCNFLDTSLTRVYLRVSSPRPVFNGVPFDHLRGLLFVRPGFCDTLESTATLGSGVARGAFILDYNLVRQALNRLVFSCKSDIDPAHVAPLLGKKAADSIAQLKLARPPSLDITGQIDGDAAPGGAHEKIDFTLRSPGDGSFLGFPLANLAFAARVRDDEINLSDVAAIVAGGNLSGGARVSTAPGKHFISLDATLDNARLGLAIGAFEKFLALKSGKPAPKESKFQKKIAAGRLHTRLSAGGNYDDFLSFQGGGATEITNADLAEINLLGGLSAALRNAGIFSFTSLQFTDATGAFDIKGREIACQNIVITGPRARVAMNGSYYLDAKEMRMKAKLYPFRETRNVIGATVGFLLTPFSAALELRLDGTLEDPKWRFAYGPTSLAKALSGTGGAPALETGEPPEKSPPPPEAPAPPAVPRKQGPLR